jgi:hypothetical protein
MLFVEIPPLQSTLDLDLEKKLKIAFVILYNISLFIYEFCCEEIFTKVGKICGTFQFTIQDHILEILFEKRFNNLK